MPVVQYSMKYAEAAGLVKFDFLGLKTLTVLSHACKLIAKRGITIDLSKLPLDDAPTYAMLSRGESVGVFQFESAGMRDALRKLKPDSIEDLIALGALYRPGPMDNIPTYIACKHGLETPDYLHPSLEPILKETFGVIIYQEQVMQIAQVLSGYSLGAADLLRRAMGKKIKAEMDAQRELFVSGAVKNNVDKQQASNIFDLVAKFAGYGFNKSHAAAYAIISYQTAYIKANYPVEFLVASLNLEINDTDKINVFRNEAQAMNVPLLPPDINHSEAYFSIENNAIRYGIGALKSVGVQATEVMVSERATHGPYKDIFDLAARNDSKSINKRQLESMIKAGACDGLNPNRKQLLESVDTIIRYSNFQTRERSSTQISLFGESTTAPTPLPALVKTEDFNARERLGHEYDAIGFYLNEHPLDNYRASLKKLGVTDSGSLQEGLPYGTGRVKLAGMVTSCKIKVSPRGRFAYVSLTDSGGPFEVAVFDEDLLNKHRELLGSTTPIIIACETRKDEGGIRIIADSISSLDDMVANLHTTLHISLTSDSSLAKIRHYCTAPHPQKRRTSLQFSVHTDAQIIDIAVPEMYYLPVDAIDMFKTMEGVVKVEEVERVW
jgi:DNA polymerase III subunit alpha